MIRSMQHSDVTDVLSLLDWMDGRPEREVFAPDARTPDELRWENRDKVCVVDVDDLGSVRAYCALAPVLTGPDASHVIEGPLASDPAVLVPVLRAALRSVEGAVHAFCARENSPARRALEEAGFTVMNTTEFWRLPRPARPRPVVLPPGARFETRIDPDTYRALYRASEDVWATRLTWSVAQFRAHFGRDDLHVRLLVQQGRPVGFAEVEVAEGVAQLTYLAVHPAERGQGFGRLLLREASRLAFDLPGVREVRARAHAHERPALQLYAGEGFAPCRAVVTYLRPER